MASLERDHHVEVWELAHPAHFLRPLHRLQEEVEEEGQEQPQERAPPVQLEDQKMMMPKLLLVPVWV